MLINLFNTLQKCKYELNHTFYNDMNNKVLVIPGYSYGQSLPTHVTRNEGTTLSMAALTFSNEVEECYLETPQGMVVEFTPKDESNDKYENLPGDVVSNCRVNLNNIDINDNGIWTIVAVTTTGTKLSQSYNLSVIPYPGIDFKFKTIISANIS